MAYETPNLDKTSGSDIFLERNVLETFKKQYIIIIKKEVIRYENKNFFPCAINVSF